jgi:hypothetical protein
MRLFRSRADPMHMAEHHDQSAENTATSRTRCPRCGEREVVLGTKTVFFVYLRCSLCFEFWSIPERRAHARRPVQPSTWEIT